MKFEWNSDKAAANEAKHGVTFDEAIEVFDDANAVTLFDTDHSIDEDRFMVIGLSSKRLLNVVYVERDADALRVISARKASVVEKRLYEKQ